MFTKLFKAFREANEELYFVGGFCRDLCAAQVDDDLLILAWKSHRSHGGVPYIDKGDNRLPKIPSVKTAKVLKEAIKSCRRLIVFITTNSKESKWIPWELGIGDGAKTNDLGALMAHESKDWTKCINRYFYTHHIHHKTSKDFIGVTVESLRSPSGTDSWHDRNGYKGVPKAVEGFLHHKVFGQVARITHIF